MRPIIDSTINPGCRRPGFSFRSSDPYIIVRLLVKTLQYCWTINSIDVFRNSLNARIAQFNAFGLFGIIIALVLVGRR